MYRKIEFDPEAPLNHIEVPLNPPWYNTVGRPWCTVKHPRNTDDIIKIHKSMKHLKTTKNLSGALQWSPQCNDPLNMEQ